MRTLTILYRMRCKQVCITKYIVGALLTIMGVIAFNLGRPSIETDTSAAFSEWYQSAARALAPTANLDGTDVAMRITVTAKGRIQDHGTSVWNVPSASLRDPRERENTARVLQLIRESGIFGQTSLRTPSKEAPFITITIQDRGHEFTITAPYSAVEQSIQLQNLLKLLEVYSNQSATPIVNPARL